MVGYHRFNPQKIVQILWTVFEIFPILWGKGPCWYIYPAGESSAKGPPLIDTRATNSCRLYIFAAGSPLQMSNNIQSETEAAVSCLCKDDAWSQVNESLRFYRHKNCTKNTINVRNIWNFIQNNSTFLCPLSSVYPPLVSDCVYGTFSTCCMKNVMPDTFWAEAHNSLIHQLSLSIHLIWLFTTNHYLNCAMVAGGGEALGFTDFCDFVMFLQGFQK